MSAEAARENGWYSLLTHSLWEGLWPYSGKRVYIFSFFQSDCTNSVLERHVIAGNVCGVSYSYRKILWTRNNSGQSLLFLDHDNVVESLWKQVFITFSFHHSKVVTDESQSASERKSPFPNCPFFFLHITVLVHPLCSSPITAPLYPFTPI